MHFRCVLNMLKWYVLVGLDWAKHVMFLLLHITCSCIFHTYVLSFIPILILICVSAFLHVSLSLSLFLSLVALWHLNGNLLRPGTLFVSEHLLLLPLLTLLHIRSGSVLIKPVRTFRRTFTTRYSLEKPSRSIKFFRYWPSHYHLQ